MHRIILILFAALSLGAAGAARSQQIPNLSERLELKLDSLQLGQLHLDEDWVKNLQGRDSSLNLFGNTPLAPQSHKHYIDRGDTRFYMNVIPPRTHAKQVDHTHVWLLASH